MNKKIFELLEAKFQGVRKDGLQHLAVVICFYFRIFAKS